MFGYLKQILQLSNLSAISYIKFSTLFFIMTLFEMLGLTILATIIRAITDGNFYWIVPDYFPKLLFHQRELNILDTIVFLGLFFVAKALFEIFSNFIIIKQTAAIQYKLKMQIFSNIGNKTFARNGAKLSDTIISSQLLTSQFQTILNLIIKGSGDILLVVIASVYLLSIISLNVALFMLISVCILVLCTGRLSRIAKKSGKLANVSNIAATATLEGFVRGLKEITAYNGQPYFSTLIEKQSLIFYNALCKKQLIQILPKIYIELIFVSFLLFLVFEMDNQLASKESNASILIILIIIRLMPLVRNLINLSQQVHFSNDSITRLKVLLFNDKDIIGLIVHNNVRDLAKERQAEKFISLTGRNIRKSYGGKDLFSDLSFNVERGNIVGFVGQSGSGKTTLIDIIAGFETADAGELRYNDRDLSKRSVREMFDTEIGYVSQDPVMFNGTVLQNITYGAELTDKDKERLITILEKLNFLRLFNSIDSCLNFDVGDMGKNLSGGMKQRMSLARALYFERQLILLDEPSSALDAVATRKLFEIIRGLDNTTFIIITHDPMFEEMFDVIYKVNK